MATIGDTNAPSTNTIYFDSLLSTTLMAYQKTLFDNIFKDSAFLAYLRLSGAWQSQDGGERIAIPLMYGTNSTVKTHGPYDIIDTTPTDNFTTAFYEWAEIAGSISLSRKERRQNSGEGRLLNLLQSKITEAEMTMTEKLNNDLLLGTVSGATFIQDTSLTSGTYGLNPLFWFLRKLQSTDPISNTVGNISSSSNSWWRARASDASASGTPAGGSFGLSATTWKALVVHLRRMYNWCSRGSGGSPDFVVFDQGSFEAYENALDQNVRYVNTKMADMGFDTIKLRGATCIWDEVVPDVETGTAAITKGTAAFINSKFYKVIYDSETNIITTPFVEPENQTVMTAKILFMGNAAVSNMRKHGHSHGIDTSLIA